ncbi:MAG: hypothetical protein ACI4SE_08315 [Lachnospiraceae bacterium]
MDKRIICKRMKGFFGLILALGIMLMSSQTVLAATYTIDTNPFHVGDTLTVGDTITSSTRSVFGTGMTFTVYIDNVQLDWSDEQTRNNYRQAGNFYLAGEPGTTYWVTECTNVGTAWDDVWTCTLRLSSTEYVAQIPTQIHTHSYSWVTVREADMNHEGLEAYRCSCGDVKESRIFGSDVVFVSGMLSGIKNAPLGGVIEYESGEYHTMMDKMIALLAERSDVSMVTTFTYNGVNYKMTVPAGVDYTEMLSDDEIYYGYFYFALLTGATIEVVE